MYSCELQRYNLKPKNDIYGLTSKSKSESGVDEKRVYLLI